MKRLCTLVFVCFSFMCQAHGYWFDVVGTGKINSPVKIQIAYGEIDEFGKRNRETGDELTLVGMFKLFVMDQDGHRQDLSLKPERDCWEASFLPTKRGNFRILAINETLPVVDRSAVKGKSVRPVDFLCTDYLVETADVTTHSYQFLDIICTANGPLISAKIFKEKMPVDSLTKIRVFNPENWEKNLSTDAEGSVSFAPTMKGLYIIRQDWTEPKGGNYKGVQYSAIRYRCNYCLRIE